VRMSSANHRMLRIARTGRVVALHYKTILTVVVVAGKRPYSR
jgi:hypothetical protein